MYISTYNRHKKAIFAINSNKHYMYMELRLKELCQLRGITQKELAGKLGVTEMTLSRASKGNTSMKLLEEIANCLNIEFVDLFERPKNDSVSLTCPHCGKAINIKLE